MNGTAADHALTFTQGQIPESEQPVTLLSRIKTMAESADNSGDLNDVTDVLCRVQRLITELGAGEDDSGLSGMSTVTCQRVPGNAKVVPGWLSALAAVVCLVSGCHWYFGHWRDNGGNPRRSVTFSGRGALPDVSECLFTLLCRQMWRDLDVWRRVSDRERLENTAIWYRTEDWCCYWVAGIWSALQEGNPAPEGQKTPDQQSQCQNHHHLRRYRQLTGPGAIVRKTGPHCCLFPAGNRHTHIKEEQP